MVTATEFDHHSKRLVHETFGGFQHVGLELHVVPEKNRGED